MTAFSDLGLSRPLLRAIEDSGYTTPTPIQKEAIPAVLTGKDVMAAAQTGTGKTAGFTLPLLHRLSAGERVRQRQVRALVLTPTRELAAQVGESVRNYSKYQQMKSTVVFGGVGIQPQIRTLKRGVDVLVATPGRLLDLHGQGAVEFDQLDTLILDEADRMLDMGFIRDIRKILALLPKQRQNLLFSATFSDEIRSLAKGFLKNPLQVEVSPRNTAAHTVRQQVYEVDKAKKTALLSHLIRNQEWNQVLVFTRTKHGANRLTQRLERAGITAAAIHGNKSQGARTRALSDFKANRIRVLVATDIAARGIDISELPFVVNFELPNVSEDYVHRIGRTGRAGCEGLAVSLVSADEVKLLFGIERLLKQTLTREVAHGFIPTHTVPMSRPVEKTPSPKKSPRKKASGEGKKPGDGNRSRRRSQSSGTSDSGKGRSPEKATGSGRANGDGENATRPNRRRRRSRRPQGSRPAA